MRPGGGGVKDWNGSKGGIHGSAEVILMYAHPSVRITRTMVGGGNLVTASTPLFTDAQG